MVFERTHSPCLAGVRLRPEAVDGIANLTPLMTGSKHVFFHLLLVE